MRPEDFDVETGLPVIGDIPNPPDETPKSTLSPEQKRNNRSFSIMLYVAGALHQIGITTGFMRENERANDYEIKVFMLLTALSAMLVAFGVLASKIDRHLNLMEEK